jgi:hypothetical protein
MTVIAPRFDRFTSEKKAPISIEWDAEAVRMFLRERKNPLLLPVI